jgi:paraquat-inducible protein B
MKRKHFIIIAVVALVFLAGCMKSDLNIQIRFEKIDGLQSGDPIVFENNRIGTVKDVRYTEKGDYLVEAVIESDFVNAATKYSQFFVAAAPDDPEKRVIEIEQEKTGGEPLKDGAVVRGSKKPTLFKKWFGEIGRSADKMGEGLEKEYDAIKEGLKAESDDIEKGLDDAFKGLVDQFQRFGEQMKKVPESEEVQRMEKKLKEFARELEKSAESVQNQIQEKVVPELKKELDNLREKLEEYDREDEVKPLEKELDGIKRI